MPHTSEGFCIAGVFFSLDAAPEVYKACVIPRYLSAFISDGMSRHDLVHARIEALDKPEEFVSDSTVPDVRILPHHQGYRIEVPGGIFANVDEENRSIVMMIPRALLEGDCFTAWIPFSSLLRIFFSIELPKRNSGLLMHASSIETTQGAQLFLGPSGAGKSTVCDLGGERNILNDEVSILRRISGSWVVEPSPFFSRETRENRAIRPGPVAGIHLLTQSEFDSLESLSIPQALAPFMRCIMNFLDGPEVAERLLELSTDCLMAHPATRLYFTPTPAFWSHIEAD